MKRDMDLVRKILMHLESEEAVDGGSLKFIFEGFDEKTVTQHVLLMHSADLIRVPHAHTAAGTHFMRSVEPHITWEGYEFLEAARSDTIWAKARGHLTSAAVGTSFELLTAYLKQLAAEKIGINL